MPVPFCCQVEERCFHNTLFTVGFKLVTYSTVYHYQLAKVKQRIVMLLHYIYLAEIH